MFKDLIKSFHLRRKNRVPLYIQFMDQIKDMIRSGVLKPNDHILPERELSSLLGVSTICVHNALKELRKQGFINRSPGRGSFVAGASKKVLLQKVVGLLILKGTSSVHPAMMPRLIAIDTVLKQSYFSQQFVFFDDADDQVALVEKFRNSADVAGFLILNEVQETLLDYFAARRIPAVRLNGKYRNRLVCCVVADGFHHAYVGVRHLIDHGHKRIGFIKGLPLYGNEASVEGYQAAMKETFGKDGFQPLIKESCYGLESGKRLMGELLREQPDITGVLCCEDFVALGAWETLREQGRRVPEDVALIGSGNFEQIMGLNPRLTTFDMKFEETSSRATEILLRLIAGEENVPICTMVYPNLITRNSCGCGKHESMIITAEERHANVV